MVEKSYTYVYNEKGDTMKVVISAGGTGGHIYPALAIIDKIKKMEPDSEFIYIGTHDRMEKDIIPSKGIPYKSIEIYGFNKKKIMANFKTISCLFEAKRTVKKILKDFKPDIVIGVGGYVTVPVISVASNLGFKTFIHEQNSIPGKANRFLAKKASIVGISFKSSRKYFSGNVILTGNPCSESAKNIKPSLKSDFGLSNKPLILFVMGSLGASKVNDFLVSTMNLFVEKNYNVLYLTGNDDYDRISKINFPSNIRVLPYVENLTSVMKISDIIVTRAGASTLSEVIALELPSIIIPSPYVANNHQYINALDFVNNEAGFMIEEKNLSGDILVRSIDDLFLNVDKIEIMKKNLRKMQINNSAEIIYREIKVICDGK